MRSNDFRDPIDFGDYFQFGNIVLQAKVIINQSDTCHLQCQSGGHLPRAIPERNNAMNAVPPFARYSPQLLAALRIVAGVLFLSHGLVKLFGFPPGAAPGIQPLMTMFGIGAVIELVTGTLIVLGLFTRTAALIASGEMAVGYWMFHAPASIYPAVNGGDAAVLFCFIFLYLVAAGPGAFSLEDLFRQQGSPTPSPVRA
jgi:putative oxidoreductase